MFTALAGKAHAPNWYVVPYLAAYQPVNMVGYRLKTGTAHFKSKASRVYDIISIVHHKRCYPPLAWAAGVGVIAVCLRTFTFLPREITPRRAIVTPHV